MFFNLTVCRVKQCIISLHTRARRSRCQRCTLTADDTLQSLTEKVDIYGMGMIFFSLMSGKLPFDNDPETENKILNGEKPVFEAYWPADYMKVSEVRCMFTHWSVERQATDLEPLLCCDIPRCRILCCALCKYFC